MENNSNLQFIPLGSTKHSTALNSNRFRISISKGGKQNNRFYLNKEVSDKIREGEYHYMRVGFNDYSSELYFIFCKKQTPDSLTLCVDRGKKIDIASTYLIEQVVERLGLEVRTQELAISDNISNSQDYLTYRVTKQ